MKFFIPHTRTAEQAEEAVRAVRLFLAEQDFPTRPRRFWKLDFRHNGEDYALEVGAMHPDLGEPVLLILEASDRPCYYVCTPNRGVLRGEPYLVGLTHARAVPFEEGSGAVL
jgi:hypothetical protein